MIWFGSSAGVALCCIRARSVGLWLRHGWFIAVAYVAGFLVMLAVLGSSAGAATRCSRRRRSLPPGADAQAWPRPVDQ